MRNLYIMLLSITAVSALTVTVMVVAFPDHNGELRMSPEVGDYFVINVSGKSEQRFTVTEILEDAYNVEIKIGDDTSTLKMKHDDFYRYIYLEKDKSQGMEINGRVILDTNYGKRMCTLYAQQMGTYWADDNGVIYQSFVGGVGHKLLETSLFYRFLEGFEMRLELNDSQYDILAACLSDADSTSYNLPLFEELPPGTDAARLESAIRAAVSAHPMLTMKVSSDGEGSFLEPADGIDLETVEMAEGFDPCGLVRPFDLGKGACRFRIVRSGGGLSLFMDIHHIVMDGMSLKIIARDIGAAYAGRAVKPEDPPAAPGAGEPDWGFYDSFLSAVESPSLPLRDNYIGGPGSAAVSRAFRVDAERLRRFCKDRGISRTAYFAVSMGYALERMDPKGYASMGVVMNCRDGSDKESVGMIARTLPLAVRFDCSVGDSMAAAKGILDGCMANPVAYSKALARYGLGDEVIFAYQGDVTDYAMVSGLDTAPRMLREAMSPASEKIRAEVADGGDGYIITVTYRTDYYTEGMMASLASIFARTAEQALDCKRFQDIDIIGDPEEALKGFNDSDREQDLSITPIDMIERWMRERPDSVAAVFRDNSITYGQLDSLTSRIAAYLAGKGIGREDFVSVLIRRGLGMVTCPVGILRSGAAYQPLDPSYPKERLNFMVKDSGAKLVIADRDLVGLIDEYDGDILYTDELESLPDGSVDAVHGPGDVFTILYTSGTTGTPKGCILENMNLASVINHDTAITGRDVDSRTAAYASFGFDASMMDTFASLATGGTLYIIPEDMRLDLGAMDRYFNENSITHAFMTTQVGRQFITMTTCRSLKHFLVGGEKLVPVNPKDWVKFWNIYGPTEAAVYVLTDPVTDDNPLCPIGWPNANVRAYIVDSANRRVPVGVPGELIVSGPQVSRGYLNRPEKTAEAFIKNPFCDSGPHVRAYRTGDTVRWLPDGRVEYIGRGDGQVKVRGFRVELTEVEGVIRKFPGIEDATVAAFDSPAGGKFIAAYVVSKEKIDVKALNEFIAGQKPPYMVPAVTMQIDRIPLNVNSKVDRRKLPVPTFQAEDDEKPQNDVQERIFKIAAELLGTDAFGIGTDLRAVGLTSITSIRLSVLLSEAFDIDMAVSDLKGDCTVKAIESFIGSKHGHETFERRDDYPLSKIQEGLFVDCVANPGTTIYNVPFLLRLDGPVDIARLKDSVVAAVEAHPHIKARLFTTKDGEARQRRMDDDPFTADEIEDIEAGSIDDVIGGLVRPFELIGGRLFRFAVVKAKEGTYLFTDVHHLYMDGTSMNVFLDSITAAYLGERLERERFSGFDVVLAEERRRTPEALAEDRAYYDSLLGGCETDILPTTDLYEKGHGLGSVVMDGAEIAAMERYCEANGVTMNGYMCSALGFTLSKFCGTQEPVFTTVYSGRNDSRTMDTVAMLVRTTPVVCRIAGSTPDYMRTVSKTLMDNMAHDSMSFAEICKEYGFRPDILFVYQGDMFTFDGLCDMHSEPINLPNDTAKTPITYSLWVVDGRLHHVCEYDRARFSHAFVESFVRAFDNAIVRMMGHTDPKDIDLSDEITLKQIEGFNDTAVEQDLGITPLAMIERHMGESPDRTAVVFNGRGITYSELDSLSTRIAAYVQSKGIGTEDYVSVLVHRSENIAVATVGVIRSGAAYQPLDPSYPKERLNFMVKDSGAKLVIADRDLIELLDEYKGDVLFTDEVEKLTGTHRHVDTRPGDAFTILYTSGTTGTPKGCILENRNVASTVNHYARNLESGPDMRTASYASYGFDANMMDIFVTLCAGGALYVIPEDMRLDLPQVDRFFTENGITHAFMTTQVGRQFITMTRCRTLKHFLVGGEKLVPVVPTEWVDFVNIYGPTETSIYVLSSHVKDDNPLCPIGRPNDNTRVYVVDGSGHQLPIGAVGELYIAGPQVSRGYLNRPDKTAEAFIRNPFTDEPDYRNAYRTGDVVRWLPDGNIEYIGRRDGQVKIRGFRVELTEIEKVIREFDGIRDATVAAFDSPSGGKFVAAYVVSDGKVDIDAMNAFIGARKPPYMVPAVTMQIERIPLNVNSKVDRRKLPVPTPSTRTAGKMPSNDMEKRLCDIYAAVLGVDTVYADDSFFAIGGTSISASRLVVSCMNEGIPIVYKNVFDNPTPIALAAFLKGYGGRREEKVEEVQEDSGVLAYNVAENLDGISRHGIGDVLLTGATGFLGIHVLKEVLDRREGSVTCLIRGNKRQSARDRLKTMLMYYFGGSISESDIESIGVVEADITDEGLKDAVAGLHIDTIINCAAVVKHFAFDDSIEKVNHYGVRNLIDVALAHDAVLVQTSTLSVAGESVNGSVPESVLLKENMLEFGQNLDNKYVHSKHMAERAILESIEKDGLKGKIFRAGNLMSRESDGEFQINFATNNFMRCIRSYILLGCYPVDDLDASAEFSPIDMTAKALVTLAGTPEKFTVFNGNNPHCVHMYNVIEVLRANGFRIDIVDRDEFDRRFAEKLKDESVAGDISGLISYMGNDGEFRREIGADNRYTVKALYRLGFSWPIIDLGYIERAVKSLEEFRFFRNER